MRHTPIALMVAILLISNIPCTTYARTDPNTYKVAVFLRGGKAAFKAEMAELGYVEGENLTYLDLELVDNRTEAYLAELEKQVKAIVEDKVDAFVVEMDSDAVYFRSLIGDSIPIVFTFSDNPVATGAVADLIYPGGNTTGVVTNKSHERRIQLLVKIKPTTQKVYYIMRSSMPDADITLQETQTIADIMGVEIVSAVYTGNTESGFEIIRNIPEGTDWVFFTPTVFLDPQVTAELLAFSVERRIGLAWVTDEPMCGYVMGYGPNFVDASSKTAQTVDRILRGASPADLPVQIADNFLMINLEAADAIGLEIPESLLRQASLIIRPGYFENTVKLSK